MENEIFRCKVKGEVQSMKTKWDWDFVDSGTVSYNQL